MALKTIRVRIYFINCPDLCFFFCPADSYVSEFVTFGMWVNLRSGLFGICF